MTGASASPPGSHPSGQAPAGLDAPRFDPSRGADNILPLLTATQCAFILRMEPTVLDQEITKHDWDNINPKVDNPDENGWPYWHWFGGMRLTWPLRDGNAEITFRFNSDGIAVREALVSAARQGDAQ